MPLCPQVRPPMPPAFFFVIDVSQAAVASGVLAHVCRAVRASLDRLPGGERTRVGFLTFDSALHFYNLKAGLSQPQMMVRRTAAAPGRQRACLGRHCLDSGDPNHTRLGCKPFAGAPSRQQSPGSPGLRAGGGGADGAVCAAAGRPAGQLG